MTIGKMRIALVLYISFCFLLTLYFAIMCPHESALLTQGDPHSVLCLPVLAGILAYISVRHPTVGTGSGVVVMLIESVMRVQVDQMTPEQNLLSYYYIAVTGILVIGAVVGLIARIGKKEIEIGKWLAKQPRKHF